MSNFELVTANDDTIDYETTLRNQIFDYVISQSADTLYSTHMKLICKVWIEFNNLYFDGKLTPAFIGITPPKSPKALGDCAKWSMYGGKSQIRLRPCVIDGTYKKFNPNHSIQNRWKYILDILLHEQIHQWQYEILSLDEDGYQGHGVEFTQKANEISDALGLPHVVERRRKDKSLPIASQWPDNVRPAGYYGDLFKVVEPKEPEPETEDEPEEDELSPLDVAITAYANLTEHDRGLFHNAMDLVEKSKIPAVVTVNDDKLKESNEDNNELLSRVVYLEEMIKEVFRGESEIIMYDNDDEIYFKRTARAIIKGLSESAE